MKTPIDFYFDFVSPYGYLGSTQVEGLAAAYRRTVEWRPFLLGVTVMKVMGLKPLMETPLKSDYVRLDKARMASLLGVALASPDMKGANSIAASRAFYWLKDRDPALAVTFAKRLLHRLWVEGRETTTPDAVADEAQSLGVGRAQLLEAIASDAVKDQLRAEVDAAIARGVFGSPFFIVDEQPIWGVDRLWMLEHWLEYGHWKPVAR
ncbi:MAG TPA: 2-hydroxychromene-2-carboxylate isomerase [Usitatibacter sp.]|nr:2-hydroxychromene-2-carboxylate isomerase [Usitatibacter sp.]